MITIRVALMMDYQPGNYVVTMRNRARLDNSPLSPGNRRSEEGVRIHVEQLTVVEADASVERGLKDTIYECKWINVSTYTLLFDANTMYSFCF